MKFCYFKFGIVYVFIILSFLSCEKNTEEFGFFDLSSDEVEMYYKETQCSDPWYDLAISHEDRSEETILKDYLRLNNINIIDLAYVKAQQDEVITCTACTCYTGAVFYVKAKDDRETISKLKKIGFKL